MDNIKDYDDDGFELSFESGTSIEERKFYVQTFTNVNMVADQANHCTCCNTHIGTAPSVEKMVCMHPVLRVTQCIKCYRFYNSGEFDKGEDGSELYCRWCGQGGDVYCCSDCAYVFCKKCILTNLSKSALNKVTSNDNWKCYSCDPKILYPLRARHWALTNFIQKQKKKIDLMIKRGNCDQDEIADAMTRDVSVCCKNKDRSSIYRKRNRRARMSDDSSENESDDSETSSKQNKKKKKSRKTAESSSSDTDSGNSERSKGKRKRPRKTAKPVDSPPKKIQPKVYKCMPKSVKNAAVLAAEAPSAQVRPSECNAAPSTDIDCTPDLFAYLVNHGIDQAIGPNNNGQTEQPSSSTQSTSPVVQQPSTSSPSVNQTVSGSQPKRVGPTVPRPAPRSTAVSGNHVFHNYNGYRIDLQNAAKQSTIRLPNGKIIHVKKHSQLSRPPPAQAIRAPTQTVRVSAPQNVRPQIVQTIRVPAPRRGRPPGQGPQLLPNCQPQARPTILQAQRQQPAFTLQNTGPNLYSIQQQQPFQSTAIPTYPNQMQMSNVNNVSAQQSTQNPVVSAPRTYTNDKIGRARTQLEQQIFNAISICHQIDGKLKILMNSNAYKNVSKLNDIKELYIHLSYLFTYTNGRFKTVQEKCMDDMRRLGFKSFANSLSSGNVIDKYGSDADEDDIEIVEPSHQTINLDSDDEQSAPHKKAPETIQIFSNATSVATQPPVQPTLATQSPAIPSSSNTFNASVDGVTPMDIETPTEHLECDVDIMALLQPQIMFDEDENIESLLTRMDDEIEIGTPPLSEETETSISTINDVKLSSEVSVRLSRAESEFPEIFKKLKVFNGKESDETEADQPLEAGLSDDEDMTDKTSLDDRPTSSSGKSTEEVSSSANDENVEKPSKEVDTADGENQMAGDQIDSSKEIVSEIKGSAEIVSDEIAPNEQNMEEKRSPAAISSHETEVTNDGNDDVNDKNTTMDDAYNSPNTANTDISAEVISLDDTTGSITMNSDAPHNDYKEDNSENTEKTIEEQIIEEQITEEQITEWQSTEGRTTEEQIIEEQITEEQITDWQSTEEQIIGEQTAEEQITEEQITEWQTTEERTTGEQITEEQITEWQITEERTTDEQTTESTQQDVEATEPTSAIEVESSDVNDTGESSKFVDAINDDFDNISSPDTFDELAQNGNGENSPRTYNSGFADALNITN